MEPRHAKLISEHCQHPELEAMLLDEKLSYWAMHEAEKVLKLEQHPKYFCELQALNDWEWMATAAQRAEAFLRTLGLWIEEPASEATVEGLR